MLVAPVSCYKYSLDLYTICTLSSIVATRYSPLLFSLFATALADVCPRGLRLMFCAAKITLRIGFTARHFDQFRDCSIGRTFHIPGAPSRPKGVLHALQSALSAKLPSRIEAN